MVDHLLSLAMHIMDYHSKFSASVPLSRWRTNQNQPAVCQENRRLSCKLRTHAVSRCVNWHLSLLTSTITPDFALQSPAVQVQSSSQHNTQAIITGFISTDWNYPSAKFYIWAWIHEIAEENFHPVCPAINQLQTHRDWLQQVFMASVWTCHTN
jgi:hypothetical protein